MRKVVLVCLGLCCILCCALTCAAPFWYIAGMEDGFTLEAFDTGQSDFWMFGMIVFFAVVCIIGIIIYERIKGQ